MSDQRPRIRFRLNPHSGVPPYRQLVDQVVEAVREGHLRPGDQLPPIREVVTQVTINPNTVQRAYRELEHLGMTRSQWGQGSFVTTHAMLASESSSPKLLLSLQLFVDAINESGIEITAALDLVRSALNQHEVKRS